MATDHTATTGILRIVSAMITPAILILAAGSLVNSTLTRLARVVDRARVLLEKAEALYADGRAEEAKAVESWLWTYNRRVGLTERALTLYYTAILLFIGSSLAIALNDVGFDKFPWVTLALVLLGGLALTFGTAALVLETNLAIGSLRNDILMALRDTNQAAPS